MFKAIASAWADDAWERTQRHRAANAVAAFARHFHDEEPQDDRCG